jgi:HicB family
MDLSAYSESLRRELTAITRFAGEDISRAAEMLAETLDSSVRLALLDVLSAAADEITAAIDGATIDVRLSGSEPEFVVNIDHGPDEAGPQPADAPDEAGTARITLRLSEALKTRVEAVAAAAGLSVNAWLVRAISRGLDEQAGRGTKPRPPFPPGKPGRPIVGKRVTGFARS